MSDIMDDAALVATFDHIERWSELKAPVCANLRLHCAALAARVAELERALRPFAAIPYDEFGAMHQRPEHILMGWNKHDLTTAHVMAARRALADGAKHGG